MAIDPLARELTVKYSGGSIRGARGNIVFLLGDLPVSWAGLSAGGAGGFRRPYGYRRASNAAAGQPIKVTFSTGEEAVYRVTGTVKRFIQEVLSKTSGLRISKIESQRGAQWAPSASTDEPEVPPA